MKHYSVTFVRTMTIPAVSEEQAVKKAFDKFPKDSRVGDGIHVFEINEKFNAALKRKK